MPSNIAAQTIDPSIQKSSVPTGLHRVKLVKNPKYVRSGKKSYGHVLRKFNIKPTLEGPFAMIDEVFRPGEQHIIHRLQNRIQGKPTRVAHRRLVKKDASGQVGEVSAEDVQNDLEYLAQVGVGTPEQTMNLDFDTGSSDLSHTYKPSPGEHWRITYGDGSSAAGQVGTDTINLGGIVIKNQAIELANQMSPEFAQGAGDGLLGLAFDSINTVMPTQVKTPVSNMIAQSAIPPSSELFTAYLASYKDANDPDLGQSFYSFGFIDEDVVNASGQQPFFTPVDNSNGFWQISSKTYSVNGVSHPVAGYSAIMDTGTTLAMVDDQTCKNIYAQIPGSRYDKTQGGYLFPTTTPLSALPNIQFDLGGKMFTVNKEDIGFADAGNGMTFGAMQSRGDMPFNIYGDTVFKSIYAIFNVGTMQFGAVQRSDPDISAPAQSNVAGAPVAQKVVAPIAPPSAPNVNAPAPMPGAIVNSPAPAPAVLKK